MRVAIDAGVLTSGHAIRGIGVNTQELIDSIKLLGDKSIEVEAVDFSKADLSGYDIVHYQYFRPFFFDLPWTKPSKKVVLTIHDVIPLLYPDHYTPGIKGSIRFMINKFLLKKNVDAIITISETSKKDIVKYLGISSSKVHVTYLAPKRQYKHITSGLDKIRAKFHLPDKFVFNFGDINYNKNIPTLIKACKILGLPMVIAGKRASEIEKVNLNHVENRHLREIYKDMTDPALVIRAGYVSDEDAAAIYSLASVYVQPSYYEGFGFSVIHAFACRTPVVASNTPALVEIAEGGALFADPNSPDDFAAKIRQVITDKELKTQLIETGKVIVKNFSWEKTAKATLKVYESL